MRWSWIFAGLLAAGQISQLGVNALVTQLESPDPAAVFDAAKALRERGPEVVPALVKTLHDNPLCKVQWSAASIIHDLQPENPVANPTFLSIAEGKCKVKQPQDYVLQRQAAFALASHADGLPLIAGALASGDTAIRKVAVVGYEDLMNSLSGGQPPIEATPDLVKAVLAALPALLKAANDSNTPVRCTAYYSLDRAAASATNADIKAAAEQAMKGLTKPTCPGK